MRGAVLVLLAFATLLLPSAVSVSQPEKPAVVYAATDARGGTLLGWTPVPFASSYLVYKGADADHLTLIGEVDDIFYQDSSPSTGDVVYYGVSATFGDQRSPAHVLKILKTSSASSSCVATQGNQIEIYAQNCIAPA